MMCIMRQTTFLNTCPRFQICDDGTFSSTFANTRLPYETPGWNLRGDLCASGLMAHRMAGYAQPTLQRTQDILRDPVSATSGELHFFAELFEQLSPNECHSFMRSTESTPREMARFMKKLAVGDPLLVTWINQYSSDPHWSECEPIGICAGDRRTLVNGRLMSRELAAAMDQLPRRATPAPDQAHRGTPSDQSPGKSPRSDN